MKIHVSYFSGTGNTERVAKIIYRELTNMGHHVDITDINHSTWEGYDVLWIGAPIHSWRLAKPVREWLKKASLGGKKVHVFATYGRAFVGAALAEVYFTIKKKTRIESFLLVPAPHAYLGDRYPIDVESVKEGVRIIFQNKRVPDRLKGRLVVHETDPLWILKRYFRMPEFAEIILLPNVNKKRCIGCGVCVSKCPVGAIILRGKKAEIHRNCIKCMKCSASCPVGAISPPTILKLLLGGFVPFRRRPVELFLVNKNRNKQ